VTVDSGSLSWISAFIFGHQSPYGRPKTDGRATRNVELSHPTTYSTKFYRPPTPWQRVLLDFQTLWTYADRDQIFVSLSTSASPSDLMPRYLMLLRLRAISGNDCPKLPSNASRSRLSAGFPSCLSVTSKSTHLQ
jgi:hypothetical protein